MRWPARQRNSSIIGWGTLGRRASAVNRIDHAGDLIGGPVEFGGGDNDVFRGPCAFGQAAMSALRFCSTLWALDGKRALLRAGD
jgi:hypothetical protein